MRGKGTKRCSSRRGGRITPAYAGKSKRIAPSSVLFGDHPRVCGEKAHNIYLLSGRQGSPPRMRGKVRTGCADLTACGITPAYAGKSAIQGRNAYHGRDHPRVCGEKSMVAPSWGPGTGSPPRMRGKVLAALMPTNALGITPAYAGKSSGPLHVNCLGRDHPRVCGEKCLVPVGRRCAGGSPPRMRGKEIAPLSVWLYLGITPAYAGKRAACRS